jgi:hypothetical protein
MKTLRLLNRTSDRHTINLASWHSKHSLTWSWILSFSFFRPSEARVLPLFYTYMTNQGRQWGLRIPFIGAFRWHRQQPMFYRDMWQRDRDLRDGLA